MVEVTNRAKLQIGPSIRRTVKGWDDINKTYIQINLKTWWKMEKYEFLLKISVQLIQYKSTQAH